MGTNQIRVMIPKGNQAMITKVINMSQEPQAKEGHLHQDPEFAVKGLLMTQASVKLLNMQ